jgi:hypothetical protein
VISSNQGRERNIQSRTPDRSSVDATINAQCPPQYCTVNPELTNCEEALRMVCLLPSSGPKNTGSAAVPKYRDCAADELRIIITSTPRSRALPGIGQGTLIGQPLSGEELFRPSSPPLPLPPTKHFHFPFPFLSAASSLQVSNPCQKKPPSHS